jgi:hypothetical protein
MISYLLGKGEPQRKLLATRSVRWVDMAIYLGSLFLTVLAYVLVKNSTLDIRDLAVLRNIVSLTGLAVLSSHVFGKGRNWILPLGLTLTTMVAGVDFQNRPFGWAWLLHPYDDALASAFSAMILLIALAVSFFDYERN